MRNATRTLGLLLACCGGPGVSCLCAEAPAEKPTRPTYTGPAVGFVEDRSRARMRPACRLRLPQDKVRVHTMYLGGGYGTSDAVTNGSQTRLPCSRRSCKAVD